MSAATAVRNLGAMPGPVLIFGGPYSNLAATRAMCRQAEDLAIPPERVVCTGDVVAYCAEPVETVRLVRDWGIAVVRGNCEEALGSAAADCGCGFEAGTTCAALATDWYHFANRRIAAADREWMRRLPGSVRFELAGRSVRIVHGGVRQINRFIFPSTAEAVIREELDRAGTDLLVGGHCGIPCAQKIDRRAWLNAGAIGLPANDGTRDGWYLLLHPEGDRIRCRWQRLPYAAEETRQKMLGAGLGGGYAETLRSGLWPSMDVLPAAERARRGTPITLQDLRY
jgi:predicted phosphodiesterase